MTLPSLLPDRYPNRDFFIADIFDNLPFKDDMASMEHPIFTLSKKKDMRNLEYRNGNVSINIKPNSDGLPTIFDKDVLLYCGSLMMAEINQGRIPPKTMRISSHDLLIATNRPTSGEGYKLLKKALDRLTGVTIKTNIKTNKREQTEGFHLIDSYRIVESSRVKDRMIRLEVTMSDWFYNSILGKEVLTINREYFQLGKPLERRLYEIARKHCGNSSSWDIGLIRLMEKTGSMSTLRLFRSFIKAISGVNHLPDYIIHFSSDDTVTFTSRNNSTKAQTSLPLNDMPSINAEAIRRGAKIVEDSATGWDYNAIRSQFTEQIMAGFKPDNVNGAFINFVKKKVAARP
jgi:plasmid replication initiation protein